MAQVMTFPKELERQFWRDADFTFLIIWFITFVVINGTFGYLQTKPLVELTAEDVAKFNQAIFRIKIDKPEVVADEGSTGSADVSVGEADTPVEEATEEVAQVSAEERRAVRESRQAARAAIAESRRQAIANRIKILGGPTVRSRSSRRGGADARAAVGLSSGGGGGDVDLGNALAIVGGADAAVVKSARGGGAAGGDLGDISLSDLQGFLANADNLSAMLKEAPLKLSRRPKVQGKGSTAKQRSPDAIFAVVNANKGGVNFCYLTYKRRDPNLKGQVVIGITIAASGEVTRVRFRKSEWGRNPLQKDIENCIQNLIMQWRFAAIAEGEVTTFATFNFTD